MQEYIAVLKKYAVFYGRASRREYWMFFLFNFLVLVVLGIIENAFGLFDESSQSVLGGLYNIAVMLPSIGVAIRRAHDTGKSGWWILVPIYSFILMLLPGDKGDNAHGPDPYATGNAGPIPPLS